MPKAKPRESLQGEAEPFHASAWLTRAAFVLAIAIVLARATMLETVRDATDVTPGAEPVPRGPGPAASLVLDLVAWLPALLVLGRSAVDRAFRIRFTGAHGLMIALGSGALLSTAWAGDRFSAVVSGFHFLSAAVFLWSVSQLVRSWRRLRRIAGVCLALLLVYGAQGLTYRYVDRAEMRRDWEQNREQRLRDAGLEIGTFAVQQFEAKLLRGEMMGFNASPNTFAAVTVLLIVVTLGVVVQRRVDGDAVGWIIVPVLGLIVGACIIVWCDSKTAFVTPVIAGGILVILRLFRERVAKHARLVYAAGVVCVVLATAAVIGHGMYHGSLVIDSMTFRWRYWVGAARVFVDHPLLGVGWNNFGQHYLAARLPVAAEEIRDPHNFLVRFFAELGIAGGLLAIAWQLRLWWELTQRPAAQSAVKIAASRRALPASFAIAASALLLSVLATVDFGFIAIGGAVGSAFVILRLLERLSGGVLVLLGLVTTTVRAANDPNVDGRPAPWTLYAILAGLGVFMLHNLVDFAIFEVGPMFLFALLAGSALGMTQTAQADQPPRRRIAGLAVVAAAWLIALGFLAAPMLIAEDYASVADEHVRTKAFPQAVYSYRAAAATVPYNAEHSFRAAKVFALMGDAEQARAAFDEAIQANRHSAAYHFARGAFEAALPQPDVGRVRSDYDRALEIDPANVPRRLDYASHLETLGLSAEARKQYEIALAFNDQLKPDEVERLPASKVAEIQATIGALTK